MRWMCLPVIAAGCLMAMTAGVQADVEVVAPFVRVRVNGGVEVAAPFTRVSIPAKQQLVIPAPAPGGQPELIHPPRPVEGGVVVSTAISHPDFARIFKPEAGTYEVDLIHPYSRCAVRVCFTLPPGCPKKVRVERGELEFDYGRYEVEIRFKKDGRVLVEYND